MVCPEIEREGEGPAPSRNVGGPHSYGGETGGVESALTRSKNCGRILVGSALQFNDWLGRC